jgi:hypothetical protein
MGNLGVHMKGVLLWLIRWTRRAGTRDFCPALESLVSLGQNTIFLPAHFFQFISLHSPCSNLGRQSCWVACLCVAVHYVINAFPEVLNLTYLFLDVRMYRSQPVFLWKTCSFPASTSHKSVLLHNSGSCNACTIKRSITLLCISKQSMWQNGVVP